MPVWVHLHGIGRHVPHFERGRGILSYIISVGAAPRGVTQSSHACSRLLAWVHGMLLVVDLIMLSTIVPITWFVGTAQLMLGWSLSTALATAEDQDHNGKKEWCWKRPPQS